MVDRINFLVKVAKGLSYKHFFQILLGQVVLCIVIFVVQIQLHKHYLKKVAFMQSEIIRIQKDQEKLLKKKPQRASLSTQGYIANQMRISVHWVHFLINLSKTLPEGVWLTQISSATVDQEKEKIGGKFLLQGLCYRAEKVPKFIAKLRALSMVESVTFPYTGQGTVSKGQSAQNLLHFKFTVSLNLPKEEE